VARFWSTCTADAVTADLAEACGGAPSGNPYRLAELLAVEGADGRSAGRTATGPDRPEREVLGCLAEGMSNNRSPGARHLGPTVTVHVSICCARRRRAPHEAALGPSAAAAVHHGVARQAGRLGTIVGVTTAIHQRIAEELGVRENQVTAAGELLDGGATVPFIAALPQGGHRHARRPQLRTLEERLGYPA
jgi:hypothetical protein